MLNPTSLVPTTVHAVNGLPRWVRELFPQQRSGQAAANDTDYIVWLESHSAVVYPAIGLLVIALMAWGILAALRSSEMDTATRVKVKTDVLDALRLHVGGLSTQELMTETGKSQAELLPVLDEMAKDHQIWSTRSAERRTVWHARGVGATGPQGTYRAE
jgi:hypothetical protein